MTPVLLVLVAIAFAVSGATLIWLAILLVMGAFLA